MSLRLSQYIPPAAEPVSMTEAKIMLGLAVDAEGAAAFTARDAEIQAAVAGARHGAETETWTSLVYQCFDLYLDEWPAGSEIELPAPPLRKVEFVRYTDVDGELRTLTGYTVDTASLRGRIVLDDDAEWPSDELRPNNPIQVRFWAGYAVPFTADATTDTITAENHPWVNGDMVIGLWATGGSIPGGLVERKPYFVRDVSGDTFKLAATAGGSAINLTSAGAGAMFIGEIGPAMIGVKILLTGLFENMTDPQQATRDRYEQAASHWFAMASAKGL